MPDAPDQPTPNAALAERFGLIAKLLDLLGEDSFRSVAHVKAARAVLEYPGDLGALVGEGDAGAKKRLQEIPGVGPRIADKIVEFVTTGRIRELDELRARVPEGLVPLMEVPGLGPKTLSVLWNQGGVKSAADLKRIIEDGSILTLPRMGEKSVEKIRESLAHHEQGAERLHLGVAAGLAERVVAHLKRVPRVTKVEPAGSLRRGRETVGDLDVIAAVKGGAGAAEAAEAVMEAFRTMPGVQKVLVTGDTKTSVRLAIGPNQGRWKLDEGEGDGLRAPSIQCDLRVVDEACFGAALLYFTGSKEHNVRLRERALKLGLTLNDYGLFPEDASTEVPPQQRGVKPVACGDEAEIYRALGLMWIPPELREDRGELEAYALERNPGNHAGARGAPTPRGGARKGAEPRPLAPPLPHPPTLITTQHIKSELHAHTTASDGSHTILGLAQAARARGFHTVAVTDHSKSSAIAGGLSPARLLEQIAAIRQARREIEGITILAGSEVDILATGELDYADDLLAQLDIVVASPHAALGQDSATATKRLIKAVENPHVRILGHPTGRLVNRRPGLSPDMAAVIEAAVANNVALEINAHWMRLDLRDTHVRQAVEMGALIAIDCDVHEDLDFDNLRFGVITARRGWLTPDRCINTWDAKTLHQWLERPAIA